MRTASASTARSCRRFPRAAARLPRPDQDLGDPDSPARPARPRPQPAPSAPLAQRIGNRGQRRQIRRGLAVRRAGRTWITTSSTPADRGGRCRMMPRRLPLELQLHVMPGKLRRRASSSTRTGCPAWASNIRPAPIDRFPAYAGHAQTTISRHGKTRSSERYSGHTFTQLNSRVAEIGCTCGCLRARTSPSTAQRR